MARQFDPTNLSFGGFEESLEPSPSDVGKSVGLTTGSSGDGLETMATAATTDRAADQAADPFENPSGLNVDGDLPVDAADFRLSDPITGRALTAAEAEFELFRQFADFGTEVPPHSDADLPPTALTALQLWRQMGIWQERVVGAWSGGQISGEAAKDFMGPVAQSRKPRTRHTKRGGLTLHCKSNLHDAGIPVTVAKRGRLAVLAITGC